MGEFIDAYRAIDVNATSPEGAVQVALNGSGHYKVTISKVLLAEHDEASLAEEIEEAVISASNEFHVALGVILDQRQASYGIDERSHRKPRERTLKEQKFHDEKVKVEVESKSPRGYVTVTNYGDGDVAVRIEPGVIRRIDVPYESLLEEVNQALTTSVNEYRKSVRQLRRQVLE